MIRQIIYFGTPAIWIQCSFLVLTTLLKLTGEYYQREFSQTCLNSLSQHFTRNPKIASDYPCPSVPAKNYYSQLQQQDTQIVTRHRDSYIKTGISVLQDLLNAHNIKNVLAIIHSLEV